MLTTRGILRPRATQLDSAFRLWGTAGGSREELLDDQSDKLRRLLAFANEQIPYYRRLFDEAGVDVSRIRTGADLPRIPISSKLELREQPRSDLMPAGTDPDRLLPDRSSGSTGIKLLLWREPFERHLLQLYRMRSWLQAGVRPSDRMATVAGDFSFKGASPDRVTHLRQALRIFHDTRVSSMQGPEALLAELIAVRPDVVTVYSSVIHEVAQIVARSGETRFRPRIVLPGGETLTPAMRRVIETSLDTRICENYGAMEFNLLAWECPSTGLLHVTEDALVLEVVRDGVPVAPGERGEVVVTGLHSYAFPLIRYRLGDLAVRGPSPCPCGSPFATLESIQGRTVEYYLRADGSAVHHWHLSAALNRVISGSVGRYQIVQERSGRIVYRLMPLGEISNEKQAELRQVAAGILGEDTAFELRIEDEIPCAPSGKMLQSVNHLRPTTGRDSWDPAGPEWSQGAPGQLSAHPTRPTWK